MNYLKLGFVILSSFWLCTLFGCAIGNKGNSATVVVSANAMINPNEKAQTQPVVVTLYQLKEDNNFNHTDFFSLYQTPKQALGAEYISSQEWIIAPGATKTIPWKIDPDTNFLGALAAFQEHGETDWQSIQPIKKGFFHFKALRFNIKLDKTTINFVK